MSSVFLSHSHADKPFARKLTADLRKAGHAVWIDEAEINIGDSLIVKIREGIDEVDYVAAILSTSSINSEWVKKELDIATNREIQQKRVVVLPIILETVELPGFLKGKFYGDFTDPTKYKESLSLLIRSLGPSAELINQSDGQLAQLRIELNDAKKVVAQHEKELQKHQRTALRGKSDKLVAAITAANVKHPTHAPINITHAFEVCGQPITLDYLLWAIQKASYRGGHPLEALFTVDKKWPEVDSMIDAYIDLLSFEESK